MYVCTSSALLVPHRPCPISSHVFDRMQVVHNEMLGFFASPICDGWDKTLRPEMTALTNLAVTSYQSGHLRCVLAFQENKKIKKIRKHQEKREKIKF